MRKAWFGLISALSASILGLTTPAIAHAAEAGPILASADGSTLYVNNATTANCSDSAAGSGTAAQPFCSVQTAVDAAKPGDTVQVAYGVYGPVDVKTSGSPSAPITILGVAGGRSTPTLVTPQSGSGPALAFDHVHDVVVSHLTMGTDLKTTAVAVLGSSSVTIDHSRIDGSSYGAANTPALTVDGQSSAFTLSRTYVQASMNAVALALASGASGTVLTTDEFSYGAQPAVTGVDAPGTAVVSSTFSDSSGCNTAISLTGASPNATIENNAALLGEGTAGCYYGTGGTPVIVSAGSVSGTTADYNTIETASTSALYNWAGQTYGTPADLAAKTGAGVHDSAVTLTSTTTLNQRQTPLIDSADANAPHELSTDALDQPRVDDPIIANTGTGMGYYDRGAVEIQDPYKVTPKLTATKGPVPLVETVTASETNPWSTAISSYTFDFGDGTTTVVSSTPSVPHTFTALGSYTVKITATTAGGHSFVGTAGVQVVPAAPLVPVLNVSQLPGQSSLTVSANGAATTDAWNLVGGTIDFGEGAGPVSANPWDATTHTFAQPGPHTVTLTVTDAGGNTAQTTQTINVGSALVPFGPVRFLDTRYGTGAPKAAVGPRGVVRLKVAGANGIPATGVTAVTLNLTGLDATSGTWIAAYPDGTPVPTASNLNLMPGQITPNLVTVAVSADGYVDLYNAAGHVDLLADVEGYYSTTAPVGGSNATQAGFVTASAPARVLDTRYGTGTYTHKVGPNGTVTFQLPNNLAVGASAVLLNVTETDATASSYVATDQNSGVPSSSILNFAAGQTTSNQVVVPVTRDGYVTLYNHAGSVDLVADLQGLVYWDSWPAPPGSPYFPVAPTRIVDTRTGTGVAKAPLHGGSRLTVTVAGANGVPAGVKAVLVNLTGISPTANTWLAAYADGPGLPTSSDLNVDQGRIRAGLALVPVAADGSIDIYNAGGSIDVAADIEGYYIG